MGLLLALFVFLLLWKLGVFTLKLLGFILVVFLIGIFIHILLWPAIIVIALIAGYNMLN